MARRLRIQFPGAIYHIINRGNYRRELFATAGAARSFEAVLGETGTRFGWQIHAFVPMRNHFHLAITTPVANLGEGMHWMQTAFAVRFNRFRSESGHLFQGRYQSPLIQDAAALVRVVDYIHLNPVRAGIVSGSTACWISVGQSAAIRAWAPTGLALTGFLVERALEQDLPRHETRALKEERWNVALGKALLEQQKSRQELASPSGPLPWKVEIASRVRELSGAPYSWIAEMLSMGSPLAVRVAVWRWCNM